MESPQAPEEQPPNVASSSFPGDKTQQVPAGNALPVGTVLCDCEVTYLVGEDDCVIVYLAYDDALQREVVLKEYLPSGLAARRNGMIAVKSARHACIFQAGLCSFLDEAKLLTQFNHPSLVKVYRFWEAGGTAYMTMPYYEGITLEETLRQREGDRPNERWLKHLLGHLLDALGVMHQENCFHCDIAPDNILILRDRRPLLSGMGAARRAVCERTQNLLVTLKPGYAATEEYGGLTPTEQGAWTDIYALGAVVYFAVTGKVPTPAVDHTASDPLVSLEEAAAERYYSLAFLRGIDKALAIKPQERPQDIAEFRRLLGWAGAAPEVALSPAVGTKAFAATRILRDDLYEPINLYESLKPESSRPGALYSIGAIVFLAFLAGGGWAISRLGQVTPEFTLVSLKEARTPAKLMTPVLIAPEARKPVVSITGPALMNDPEKEIRGEGVAPVKTQVNKEQKSASKRKPARQRKFARQQKLTSHNSVMPKMGETAKDGIVRKDKVREVVKQVPNNNNKPRAGLGNRNKPRVDVGKFPHMKPMGE